MNNRKKDIPFLLGLFIILISCLVVVGWITDNPFLKSMIPGQVAMKFNTALCFGLTGISLLILDNKKSRPLLIICSVTVILIGTLTLCEYLFNWNAGIDELLWKTGDTILKGVPPGRPSIPASFNFILIGIVFLNRKRSESFMCWVFVWFVFLSALFSFLGYLFGLPYFSSVPGLSQMALHTTILFMVLSLGIYLPDRIAYLRISFRKKVVAGFMLIMFVMVTVLIIYNRNDQYFQSTSKWLQHTNDVLHRSEEVIYQVTKLESDVRAYLLTNNARFVKDVANRKKSAYLNIEMLRVLIVDNPPQAERGRELNHWINQRFWQFDKSIEARRQKMYNADLALPLIIEGSATMDIIRDLVIKIQEEEKVLLAIRKEDNRYSIASVRKIIFFFGFVMFVILFVLLIVIVRNINARIKAEREAVDLNNTLEKRVKQRTEELLKAESKFHYTLDNMMEGAQIIDFDWKYIYVNDALLRYSQFTREELIGKTVMERYPGIEQAPVFKVFERCMYDRESIHLENEFLFPDGSAGWFELSYQPIPDGIFILSVDITARKRSEVAIKKLNESIEISERTYRLIASSIPGSVISLLDRDLRYYLVEGDMLEKLGYHKQQLLGKTLEEAVPAERYRIVRPYFDRVFNGETFTVDENRSGYDTMSRYVALKDENGFVYAAMIVVFDVSELKQAQRSLAELNQQLEDRITERTAQLATANKELESFSYSVSHDLRSPLRGIDGWSLALLEDYGHQLDEKGHQYLARVRSETQRMGELIDDMLKLSQVSRTELKLTEVNISALVNEVADRIKQENPAREFVFTIQQGLYVKGDANLLDIMLTNLVSNACKFTARVSPGEISFGSVHTDSTEVFFVKDNGAGFDMENAKKLFGAFQRMHRQSEFPGTGIGLATVQRIINLHHGNVWAEAAVNEGATFYFTIP